MVQPGPLESQRSSTNEAVDIHGDQPLVELERLRHENAVQKLRLAAQNEMLVDLSLKVSKECVTVYALLEFKPDAFQPRYLVSQSLEWAVAELLRSRSGFSQYEGQSIASAAR